MSKLVIRCGESADTLDLSTRSKLVDAFRKALPDVLPEQILVLIDYDPEIIHLESPDTGEKLWTQARDAALDKASRMMAPAADLQPKDAVTLHQLLSLASRAEKRLENGPGHADNFTPKSLVRQTKAQEEDETDQEVTAE